MATAKNARGALYQGFGPTPGHASEMAIVKCSQDSFIPPSCKVVNHLATRRYKGILGAFNDGHLLNKSSISPEPLVQGYSRILGGRHEHTSGITPSCHGPAPAASHVPRQR